MGETPHAAVAATISCIESSEMLPCSRSMRSHSRLRADRHMVLVRLVPGSICPPPKEGSPFLRDFWRRLAACILLMLMCLVNRESDGEDATKWRRG